LHQIRSTAINAHTLAEQAKVQAGAASVAADAAKRAAEIAGATLRSSQESFEIDQRPYVVAEVPAFFPAGMPSPEVDIKANVTFKNIGRTPAREIVSRTHLFRYRPATERQDAAFFVSKFDEMKRQILTRKKLLREFSTEQDLAPNGTFYSTNPDQVVVHASEFPDLVKSNFQVFYIGTVSYADSSDRIYETDFCYFYFGQNPVQWH
jgi:hypothetical protein